jgi:hypothetical protein
MRAATRNPIPKNMIGSIISNASELAQTQENPE